jgi:hypothetical protein
VQPDQPRVTIVDPDAPSGPPVDVLEGGRGWRPRLDRRTLLVTLLVALIAAGAAATRAVWEDRRLDRAALAAVRLILTDPLVEPETGDVLPLALRNDGPDALRLVSVRLEAEGYAETPVGTTLAPSEVGALPVLDTRPCSPEVRTEPVTSARVTVVSHRGGRTGVQVALPPHLQERVSEQVEERCGLQDLDRSLELLVDESAPRTTGTAVELVVHLANRSVLPLRLQGFQPLSGLRVTSRPGVPFALPARRAGGGVELQRVVLRLEVRSCRDLLISLGYPGLGSRGFTPSVEVELRRGEETALVPLFLDAPGPDGTPESPATRLLGGCLADRAPGPPRS